MHPILRLTPAFMLLLGVAPLDAQAPAERATIREFDQTLSQIESLSELAPIESSAASAVGTEAEDPLAQLRLGLVRLRAGELGTGRESLDAAESALDEAVFRAPGNWPWPWYGLARAKLALAEREVIAKASMHQRVGESYRAAAFKSLSEALAADSTFAPAAALLAEVLMPLGERELSRELQHAVRRAAASDAGPAPWLALGRVQRNLGHTDSTLAAFEQFVAAGGDSGVGLLEQARALHELGQPESAAQAYLTGAKTVGPAGRAAYRQDLAWVTSPAELAIFDSLPADSVGQWVAAFWSGRDAGQLRAPGERLNEHLRRWAHAFAAYRLPPMPYSRASAGAPGWSDGNDLVSAASTGDDVDGMGSMALKLYAGSILQAQHGSHRVLDDRALVYLRHGEPDATAITIARVGNIPGGISWKYNALGGSLIFHFKCNAYCVLVRLPVSLDGLIDLDIRYEALAASIRNGRPNPLWIERIVRSRTRDIAVGLSSDSYAPHFETQLQPLVQIFALGRPERGTGTALLVFALPGEKLTPMPLAQSGVAYPLTLRLIATNARGEVSRLDTTRTFRAPDTLRAGQYLHGIAELPLAGGAWDVRAIFTQPGTEAGGAAGRLGVRLPESGGLALSDIVFGRADAGLTWNGPDGPVALNPLDVYSREGTVEIYYELGGLTPGAKYRTMIVVEGVSGDSEGEVSVAFEETARESFEPTRRSVPLDRLDGGQYRLIVTVVDERGGLQVSKERLINVLDE